MDGNLWRDLCDSTLPTPAVIMTAGAFQPSRTGLTKRDRDLIKRSFSFCERELFGTGTSRSIESNNNVGNALLLVETIYSPVPPCVCGFLQRERTGNHPRVSSKQISKETCQSIVVYRL